MATTTVHLPEAKLERLKRLASHRGVSLSRLIEEWSNLALAEFDAETRFRMLAAKGSKKRALEILDRLDAVLTKGK